MNAATFRTLHRYGAAATVLGAVIAVLSFALGGPFIVSGLFGSLSPLFGFYFFGAVLQENPKYWVLGEELMRGIVWYAGSIFGWAFIITSSSIPATAVTTFGLPTVTALGLSLLMVGIRTATGLNLKVQSEGGQLLHFILASVVVGFIVVYAVLAGGRSPSLVLLYGLAEVVGFFIWRRHWRHNRAES